MSLMIAAEEAEAPPPLIEIDRVCRAFGPRKVLDDVSFPIPEGRTTAIIGASGTGKSVLLKHIVGLLQPDSGSIRCFGVDVALADQASLYAVRRQMGMLFQGAALFDSMSVGENVGFPLLHHAPQLSPAERRRRVEAKLELVGMGGTHDQPTPELSGGQRKRVGLARAIVLEPKLVLFDEPNSGLDPLTSEAIDQLIRDMKAAMGVTFVVISHDIVGTLNVADYIAMLHGGRCVAFGHVQRILRDPHPVLRAFLARNVELPSPTDPTATARLPRVSGDTP